MPIFAAFIGGLVANLSAFFAQYLTRKLAVTAAGLTVAAAMTAALWAVMTGFQSCCSFAMPSLPGVAMGLYVVNMGAIKNAVACIVGIEIAVTLYRWHRDQLNMIVAQ